MRGSRVKAQPKAATDNVAGAKAEGLLMNVRMVNAVFEDAKRPEFDAEANTDRFIKQVPNTCKHLLRSLQLRQLRE